MKREHNYEQVIGQKLNRLSAPDVAGLWDNMEAILDREMPQQEETKRRVGAWWLNTNLLVAASLFLAVGSVYTLCQVSGKAPAVNPALSSQATVDESVATDVKNTGAPATFPFEKATAKAVVAGSRAAASAAPAKVDFGSADEAAVEAFNATPGQTEAMAAADVVSNVSETEGATENIAAGAIEEAVVDANNPVIEPITAPLKEVALQNATVPAVFGQQEVKVPETLAGKQKKTRRYSDKGLVAGLSANLPVALNKQVKNDLDMKGQRNQWQDYLPSVYTQLHLSKRFYVQAEWQTVAAQYTPGFTLYNRVDVLNPDEKEQKVVKLNKLFYTSLPVSIHYNTPLKNVTVGVGVQYSKLKKIVLQDQEYYHLIQAGGVFKVEERKNEVVVKDPETVRSHSGAGDVVDSVARSFRREDWRLMADVGYHYKGFNLGVRYSNGLRNYINTNFTNLPVKDRNEALQVYLRFNLFDSRKK